MMQSDTKGQVRPPCGASFKQKTIKQKTSNELKNSEGSLVMQNPGSPFICALSVRSRVLLLVQSAECLTDLFGQPLEDRLEVII